MPIFAPIGQSESEHDDRIVNRDELMASLHTDWRIAQMLENGELRAFAEAGLVTIKENEHFIEIRDAKEGQLVYYLNRDTIKNWGQQGLK